MAQPSDEDVDNVISFTGFTDRALIAAALKAKNNNLDQVVNDIFDDRTKFISTYGWDDKAFSAPREGTPNSQIPSFSIHAADDGQVLQGVDPDYYQGQVGAPSRPPSRTNNRSPLSRLVDYASDSNTGNTKPPMSVEQEDAELQQAIAASVATSSMQSPQPLPQESGVADADTGLPHFGPANRTEYNQNEWAMITLNHEKPEPDPSRRKREAGVPAFLRCRTEHSWEKHRVGAILTILHSIPAARNALLRYGTPPSQGYGHNPEWWKGKAIVPPGVQAVHVAGELTWDDESKPKWSEELHRLMAFLDLTERSYGTADVLADSAPEGELSSTDSERDFFDFLRSDHDNLENVKSLITTCHLASIMDDEAPYTQSDRFGMLDFPISKEQWTTAESIYSLWDRTFHMDYRNWTEDESETQFPLITEQAEILTMRLTADDGLPKRIDIPEVFYIDRYVASNRAEISKIQRQTHALVRALARADKAERRVTMVVDPASNRELSRIDLNKGAIAQMKIKRALIKQWALWRIHEEEREKTGNEPQILLPSDTPDDKIGWTEDEMKAHRFLEAKVLQLEDELARVEDEVIDIRRERAKIAQAGRELQRRLTVPDETLDFTPQHAYKLRGVVNSPDVLYVCLPVEQDLMQIDEADSSTKAADQWWKLGYVAADDEPIKAETTTFEKVMEEACGVGSKPILIYASDKSMAERPVPVPDALQTFVRFDNRLFKKELVEEAPRDKKRGGSTSPASPSKRLNRSDSIDSMATNAASAGDLDGDMRDAPFEAEEDPFSIGDGTVGATALPDLIDTSVPEAPLPTQVHYGDEQAAPAETQFVPPERNRYRDAPVEVSSSSPAAVSREASVRQMANVSLDEMVSRGLAKDDGTPLAAPRALRTSTLACGPSPAETEGQDTTAETKAPEMQERGGATSPFFLQGGGKAAASTDMELDEGTSEAHDDDQ